MCLEVIDTGKSNSLKNMNIDSELLAIIGTKQYPILHLYEWEADSATYGYFIKPEKYLNMGFVEKNLDLAKRPTGGGIVFHICDFAFSFLVPSSHVLFSNTLDSYAFVNNAVIQTTSSLIGKDRISRLLAKEKDPIGKHCSYFCMAQPTKFDVMIGDKKIGGAAQRRTKNGFLHQGTISIAMLSKDYLARAVLSDSIVESINLNSYYILEDDWSISDLIYIRHILRELIEKNLKMSIEKIY